MIILRQKQYTRGESTWGIFQALQEISSEANTKYEGGIGFDFIPDSHPGYSLEMSFGYQDLGDIVVKVGLTENGQIIDLFNNNRLSGYEFLQQLLVEIDRMERARIPNSKDKLRFLKAQISRLY